MGNQSQDMVCKALEMAEKSVEFYADAIRSCEQGPGKEVFERLYEDEKKHLERIKSIHASIMAGESWADACQLPEEETPEAQKFRKVLREHEQAQACATELGAINTGLELEKACVDFYEQWKKDAQDPTEKKFVERMVQEERAHFILLSDLQYFYEDPEGWSLKEDDQLLDGA